MFNKKKKFLEDLRNKWAKEIERFRNFDLISIYHDLKSKSGTSEIVDEKTKKDLNLESLFSKMDRTTSSIGQQYLYHIIQTYEKDQLILDKRYNLFKYFRENEITRGLIQLKLESLNNTKSYFIPSLVFGEILNDLDFILFYIHFLY